MRSHLITLIKLDQEIPYTGPELRPHFILEKFSTPKQAAEGHVLVAFQGPCHVQTNHLVDLEDRLANDHIQAKQMLHILGEFFHVPLSEAYWIQRFIVQVFTDQIQKQTSALTCGTTQTPTDITVERDGDDIYIHQQSTRSKLSVSIVAASPVSSLLHFGINIDASGAPVQAIGLNDIHCDVVKLVENSFKIIQTEWSSVSRACVKVKPVF